MWTPGFAGMHAICCNANDLFDQDAAGKQLFKSGAL
jgi:hypothetical protein